MVHKCARHFGLSPVEVLRLQGALLQSVAEWLFESTVAGEVQLASSDWYKSQRDGKDWMVVFWASRPLSRRVGCCFKGTRRTDYDAELARGEKGGQTDEDNDAEERMSITASNFETAVRQSPGLTPTSLQGRNTKMRVVDGMSRHYRWRSIYGVVQDGQQNLTMS